MFERILPSFRLWISRVTCVPWLLIIKLDRQHCEINNYMPLITSTVGNQIPNSNTPYVLLVAVAIISIQAITFCLLNVLITKWVTQFTLNCFSWVVLKCESHFYSTVTSDLEVTGNWWTISKDLTRTNYKLLIEPFKKTPSQHLLLHNEFALKSVPSKYSHAGS